MARETSGDTVPAARKTAARKTAKKAPAKKAASGAPTPRGASSQSRSGSGAKPTLLAGGNPQIAKADGEAPVRAYIEAMPGWKRPVGRRLDALIVRTVPEVRKAVRWNSPFYGMDGQGWFLSFHCLTSSIKVAFFRGTSMRPIPPVASKTEATRYFHIHEHDPIDESLLTAWIRQASRLPGWGRV
ncbi:MAG: DUF1801 domain-containing protein [Phycisphaerales bacterium]|nr:DUF1801 domain-containing protein [Phycisphaerales bacterium]